MISLVTGMTGKVLAKVSQMVLAGLPGMPMPGMPMPGSRKGTKGNRLEEMLFLWGFGIKNNVEEYHEWECPR